MRNRFLRFCFILFIAHLFSFPFPLLGQAEAKESRKIMVRDQIMARGIKNPAVLQAMRKVERHKFVPPLFRMFAYEDGPLPIGAEQTISQPYIVALMTELLSPTSESRVLEIGTGSGYQAAVLAEIAQEVYTIEIIPTLAEDARKRLQELAYKNVFVSEGDGYLGWPDKAPFDGIIVTAAPDDIPKPLLEQLKIGGRMVIPTGKYPNQTLYLIRKTETGIEKEEIIPVRFVPMTGIAQDAEPAVAKNP